MEDTGPPSVLHQPPLSLMWHQGTDRQKTEENTTLVVPLCLLSFWIIEADAEIKSTFKAGEA